MGDPKHEDWLRLGLAIKDARKRAGMRDIAVWADAISRSTRVAYGIERGEPSGEGTLENVEDVLGWPRYRTRDILAGRLVTPESQDADFVPSRDPAEESIEPVTSRALLEEIRRVARDVEDIKRRLDGS